MTIEDNAKKLADALNNPRRCARCNTPTSEPSGDFRRWIGSPVSVRVTKQENMMVREVEQSRGAFLQREDQRAISYFCGECAKVLRDALSALGVEVP
jgi:hypothetical protein